MADPIGASQALERFATLDVSLEDAVEAQALASFLSDDPLGDELNVFDVTYMIKDPERLQETFSSSNRVAQAPMDPRMLQREDDSPPPKSVYLFFDKPAPDSDADLDLETVPRVVCHGFFFGKETDRDARLECFGLVEQDNAHDRCVSQRNRARDRGGFPSRPVISLEARICSAVSGVSPTDPHARSFSNWPTDTWKRLCSADGSRCLWDCSTARPPREAANDSAYRVKLLAAIMVLDFWLETERRPIRHQSLASRVGIAHPRGDRRNRNTYHQLAAHPPRPG